MDIYIYVIIKATRGTMCDVPLLFNGQAEVPLVDLPFQQWAFHIIVGHYHNGAEGFITSHSRR